ncbi:OmpA family protein [Kineosporia sp. A_224]|uniref:OmpA family protein n=1 Tax=Kineosporia sp. A_224 TaxID=1962180 RepID=UPI000B4B1743|nr:OmpA family protein [Kineosporia sp. A_224]
MPVVAGLLAATVVGGALWTALRTQADLEVRGCAALADAGLAAGTRVAWSGRDATLVAVDDLGRMTEAAAALAGIDGARVVRVADAAEADAAGPPCAPGSTPGGGTTADGTAGGTDAPAATQTVTVRFASNSASLDRAARARLDVLVLWLRTHPATALKVGGHADNTGFDTRNQPLSLQRAVAVSEYLRSRGAKAGRIDATGFSSLRPAVPNISADNRAKNRRVEVVVEGSPRT